MQAPSMLRAETRTRLASARLQGVLLEIIEVVDGFERLSISIQQSQDSVTPEMKQWLRAAQPQLITMDEEMVWMINGHTGIYPRGVDGLAFWAVMPDLIADSAAGKDRKVAPFGVPEPQLHFVDLEYLNPDVSLRTFAADLSHKPAHQALLNYWAFLFSLVLLVAQNAFARQHRDWQRRQVDYPEQLGLEWGGVAMALAIAWAQSRMVEVGAVAAMVIRRARYQKIPSTPCGS